MSSRPRKTIEVYVLKQRFNERIARESNPETRKGFCEALEYVLHTTDNYRGFSYIEGWPGTENWKHWYY